MSRRHMPTPGYTSAAVGSSVIKMTNVSYGISRKLGAEQRSKLPVRSKPLVTTSALYGVTGPKSALPIEPEDKFKSTARQVGYQPFTITHQKIEDIRMSRNPPGKFMRRARQIVHMPLIRAVAGAGSIMVVPQSVAASMLQRARQKSIDMGERAPNILLNDKPVVLTPFRRFRKTALSISSLVSHPFFKPTFKRELTKYGRFKSLSKSICQTLRMVDARGGFGADRLIGSNAKAIKSGKYPLLIREILERLFEYFTVDELKTARLVCEFWGRFASVCLQKKSVVRLSGNCDICRSEYMGNWYMSTDETIESHEHIETISFYRFVLFILEIPQEKRYALPYRSFRIRKLNLYFISGLNTEPTRVFLMFLKIWADKIHHLHLHSVHMCPPDSFYRVLDSCERLQSVTFDSSNFWLDPLAPTTNQPFIMKVNHYLTSITFCSDWICEELLHWQMIFNAFPKLQELNLCDMSRTEINHCLSILLNLPDAEEEEELRRSGGFKTLSKKLMFQPFFPKLYQPSQSEEPIDSSEQPAPSLSFKKVTRLSINMPYKDSRQEKLEQLREKSIGEVSGDVNKFKSTAFLLLKQPFGLFSKREKKAAEQMIAKSLSFKKLAKNLVHQPFSITSKTSVDDPAQDEPIVTSSLPASFRSLKGLAGMMSVKKPPLKLKPRAKPVTTEPSPPVEQPIAEDSDTSMTSDASMNALETVSRLRGLAKAGKQKVDSPTAAESAETAESTTDPAPQPKDPSAPSTPTSKSSKMKGMAGKIQQQPFKARGVMETAGDGSEKSDDSKPSTPVGTPGKSRKSIRGMAGKVSDQPFKARGILSETDTTETETEGGGDVTLDKTKFLKGVAVKVGDQPFKARGIVAGAETSPPVVKPTAKQSKMLSNMFGKKGTKLSDALKKGPPPPPAPSQPVQGVTRPVSPASDTSFKNKSRTILNQPFTLVSPAPDMVEATFQAKPFKKNALSLVNQPFKLTGMEKNLIDRFKSTVKTIKNQPFNLGDAKPQEFVLPGSRLTKISVGLRGKFEDHLKIELPHVPGETEGESEESESESDEDDEESDLTSGMSPVGEADFNDLEINELLTEVVSQFPITHLTLRVHYTQEDSDNFPIVLEACKDKITSLTLTRHPKFYFPELDLVFRSKPFKESDDSSMKFPVTTHLFIAHNIIENINEITFAFPALTHLTINVLPTEFVVRQQQPYKTYVRTNLMFSMKSGIVNTTVRNLTWSIQEVRNPVTHKRTAVYKSHAIRHIPRIFPNLSKLTISITTAWELHTIFRYCPQLHDLVVLKNSFYRTKDADIVGVEEELLDQEEEEGQHKSPQPKNYGIKQLKFLRRLSLQNNNCNLSNLSVRQGFIHLRRLRSLHISRGARIGVNALRVLKRCRFLVHVHVTKEKLKPPRQRQMEQTLDDAELEELGLQKIPGYPGFYISLVKPEEQTKPRAKFETSTKYDKLGGKKYEVVRTTYAVNGRTYVLTRKQYEYEGERDRQIWATRYRLAEFRKYYEAQQQAVEKVLAEAEAEGLLDPAKIIRDAELRRQRELQNEESDYERFMNDYDEEEEEEEGYGEEDEEELLREEKKHRALVAAIQRASMEEEEETSDEYGICMEADTMYEGDKEYYQDTVDGKSSSENESYCDSVHSQEYQGDKEMGDLSDDQTKTTENTKEPSNTESGSTENPAAPTDDPKLEEQKEEGQGDTNPVASTSVDEVKFTRAEVKDPSEITIKEKREKMKKEVDASRAETDKIIANALMCNEMVGVEYAALKAFQAKRFSELTQVTTSSSSGSGSETVDSSRELSLSLDNKKERSKHKKDKSKRSKWEEYEVKDKHGQRRLSMDEEKCKKGHHHHHHHHRHEKKEGSKGSHSRERLDIGTNDGVVDGDMRQAMIQKMVKNVRRELRK